MPLTPDEKRNEHLKHIAGWFNTLAAGIVTAGTFVPAAQFIFNLLPAGIDNGLVVGLGVVCIGAGCIIHLLGHILLGGLR
jgi:hypothetical protein